MPRIGVGELDGVSHDLAPERDGRRDARMAEHGVTVLRFANADVHANVEGVEMAVRCEVERLLCMTQREFKR